MQGNFRSFILIMSYTGGRHDISIPFICLKYQCHPLAILQIAVIRIARLTLGRVVFNRVSPSAKGQMSKGEYKCTITRNAVTSFVISDLQNSTEHQNSC